MATSGKFRYKRNTKGRVTGSVPGIGTTPAPSTTTPPASKRYGKGQGHEERRLANLAARGQIPGQEKKAASNELQPGMKWNKDAAGKWQQVPETKAKASASSNELQPGMKWKKSDTGEWTQVPKTPEASSAPVSLSDTLSGLVSSIKNPPRARRAPASAGVAPDEPAGSPSYDGPPSSSGGFSPQPTGNAGYDLLNKLVGDQAQPDRASAARRDPGFLEAMARSTGAALNYEVLSNSPEAYRQKLRGDLMVARATGATFQGKTQMPEEVEFALRLVEGNLTPEESGGGVAAEASWYLNSGVGGILKQLATNRALSELGAMDFNSAYERKLAMEKVMTAMGTNPIESWSSEAKQSAMNDVLRRSGYAYNPTAIKNIGDLASDVFGREATQQRQAWNKASYAPTFQDDQRMAAPDLRVEPSGYKRYGYYGSGQATRDLDEIAARNQAAADREWTYDMEKLASDSYWSLDALAKAGRTQQDIMEIARLRMDTGEAKERGGAEWRTSEQQRYQEAKALYDALGNLSSQYRQAAGAGRQRDFWASRAEDAASDAVVQTDQAYSSARERSRARDERAQEREDRRRERDQERQQARDESGREREQWGPSESDIEEARREARERKEKYIRY